MMENSTIKEQLLHWRKEELANLTAILGEESDVYTVEKIEETIKNKYHSKYRKILKNAGITLLEKLNTKITHQELEVPLYSELVAEAARKLKVYDKDASINDCELYISHAVIIRGLTKMDPKQRVEFFRKQIDTSGIQENVDIKNSDLTGLKLATTAILLAQSAGMGLYLASTTALGFATHAIGVSLPFAAYTGMTSTIAFMIGPVGWLTVGLWGSWLLTGPKWKKLIPAIIYIASVNSQKHK